MSSRLGKIRKRVPQRIGRGKNPDALMFAEREINDPDQNYADQKEQIEDLSEGTSNLAELNKEYPRQRSFDDAREKLSERYGELQEVQKGSDDGTLITYKSIGSVAAAIGVFAVSALTLPVVFPALIVPAMMAPFYPNIKRRIAARRIKSRYAKEERRAKKTSAQYRKEAQNSVRELPHWQGQTHPHVFAPTEVTQGLDGGARVESNVTPEGFGTVAWKYQNDYMREQASAETYFHPRVNLSGTKFHYPINLPAVNMRQANLENVTMEEVNLEGADLREANMTFFMPSEGSLRGANLEGANLTNAFLDRVDLTGANLRGVTVGKNIRGWELTSQQLQDILANNPHLTPEHYDPPVRYQQDKQEI